MFEPFPITTAENSEETSRNTGEKVDISQERIENVEWYVSMIIKVISEWILSFKLR